MINRKQFDRILWKAFKLNGHANDMDIRLVWSESYTIRRQINKTKPYSQADTAALKMNYTSEYDRTPFFALGTYT